MNKVLICLCTFWITFLLPSSKLLAQSLTMHDIEGVWQVSEKGGAIATDFKKVSLFRLVAGDALPMDLVFWQFSIENGQLHLVIPRRELVFKNVRLVNNRINVKVEANEAAIHKVNQRGDDVKYSSVEIEFNGYSFNGGIRIKGLKWEVNGRLPLKRQEEKEKLKSVDDASSMTSALKSEIFNMQTELDDYSEREKQQLAELDNQQDTIGNQTNTIGSQGKEITNLKGQVSRLKKNLSNAENLVATAAVSQPVVPKSLPESKPKLQSGEFGGIAWKDKPTDILKKLGEPSFIKKKNKYHTYYYGSEKTIKFRIRADNPDSGELRDITFRKAGEQIIDGFKLGQSFSLLSKASSGKPTFSEGNGKVEFTDYQILAYCNNDGDQCDKLVFVKK